jgi:hypothetical protein
MKTTCLVLGIAAALSAPAWAQDVAVPADPPAVEPAPEVGYKKGFFVNSADGKHSLTVQGRVQARYQHESLDGGADDRETENAFSIARARLTLKGHAFSDDIKFKFQTDFGKGGATLKDFLIDYALRPGVIVRAGQWKRPLSRQQINSSGSLELVDRAITDKAFGAGRDIGVAVHNNYEKSPDLEWIVGVFNGTGEKPVLTGDVVVDPMTGEGEIVGGGFSNVPDHILPAVVARVGINRNGIKGYSEADLEGGPLRFGVGASVLSELDTDGDDSSRVVGEVDYVVKSAGFSTTGGVYVASAQDGAGFGDQSYAALGAHVQAGYMLAGIYQPALRVALVDPDGDDNNTTEITGGFSVYAFEHGFKWQTDVGALIGQVAGADSTTDLLARTQLQLSW